jgi:hypothetical protein
MTLILSTDDAIVTNDVTLNDLPAVRMTGNRVRFTNSESGRVISATNATPAIIIEGNGGTIINQFDGIIRLFDPFAAQTAAAILGSSGNDVVMNSGVIRGRTMLGDGDDEFHLLDYGQINYSFSPYAVDLGAGNDTYYFAPATTVSGYVAADGGDGIDRLVMDGPRQNFGATVTNFEILDIRTNGSFEGMTGFGRIEILFSTPGHSYSYIRFMNTPLADVIVGGQSPLLQQYQVAIYDRSTVRSVQGNEFSNSIQIGTDTVISGNIALGAGDDWLSFNRWWIGNGHACAKSVRGRQF